MNSKVKNVGFVASGVSLAFLINFAVGYGEVRKEVVHNATEIVEVKVEVKENTDEIDQEENINIQQQASIDANVKFQAANMRAMEKLHDRLDKALAQQYTPVH